MTLGHLSTKKGTSSGASTKMDQIVTFKKRDSDTHPFVLTWECSFSPRSCSKRSLPPTRTLPGTAQVALAQRCAAVLRGLTIGRGSERLLAGQTVRETGGVCPHGSKARR